MLDPTSFVVEPAAGRSCGSCTLCCKVFDVPVLEKPAGSWCRHCKPGRGCGIHATRPDHCRAFFCLWMTQTWLGPEWKPDKSKMVLTVDPVTNFLLCQVDPGAPNVWRTNPYYGHLKQWASGAVQRGRQVLVFLNKSATLILPDRDVSLGILGPNDRIVVRPRQTASGTTFDVEKVAA